MSRFDMDYPEFKEEYMEKEGGYVPTYVTADEDHSAEGTIKLKIEMIAPFRMTDGPARFFRVLDIEINKEQYEEVKVWIAKAGDNWKKDLIKHVTDAFDYSNKFVEKPEEE